jgi:catechol 2,3-dioxygenase-like lactoylglutathione lyase family enzyme
MAKLRLDHVAIPVFDVAGARELFGDVLGLPLLAACDGDDWDGAPWLMMIHGLGDGRQVAPRARAGTRPARRRVNDLPHPGQECRADLHGLRTECLRRHDAAAAGADAIGDQRDQRHGAHQRVLGGLCEPPPRRRGTLRAARPWVGGV